jgi:lysophospholipase L1-like esterase
VPGPLRDAAVLLAAALLLVGSGCGGDGGPREPRPQRAPLRVLFVGNSLTATNDLPAAVASIAEEGARRPLEVEAVAPGGVSLEEHWSSTGAREALASSVWDAVVLQQGPSSLPASRAHLRRWATRWADEIRAHGARPALLAVWPEEARRSAFPDVLDSYASAASAADALLLPAGAAWLAAWRRDPGLELYGADGLHPSEQGTALAALVAYAGLTGARPGELPVPGDPGSAPVLRAAAAEALAEG